MNPMYDCSGRLDRFGGVTEPPDDYYFSYRESDDSCNEQVEEEQEAFENIPESLQGTERYEVAENAVDMLESASSGLEDVISFLGDAEG